MSQRLEPREKAARLRELARLFLRLGATAFGGPAAHVAYMEREVVQKRAWLSREAFLDLYAATQLIPGPNSTELAIHLGYLRAGLAGLLVAGSCFIVPAALIVAGLAWGYQRETNGKAERFIQTMLRQWAYVRPYSSSDERAATLPDWLRWYNRQRAHGSLDGKTPVEALKQLRRDNVLGDHS